MYADFGARGDQTEFHVTFTGADNNFGAAAATPVEMLNQSWSSIYTGPADDPQSARIPDRQRHLEADRYADRSRAMPIIAGSGKVPHRRQRHRRAEFGLSRSDSCAFRSRRRPVQPDTDQRATVPAAGTLRRTSVLGRDRPQLDIAPTATAARCRRHHQTQLFDHDNHFVAGVSIDHGLVQFTRSSELGTSTPTSIRSCKAPASSSISRRAMSPGRTLAANTYTGHLCDRHVRRDIEALGHGGGRFNMRPDRSAGRTRQRYPVLNGNHDYSRFNPMVGATYKLTPNVTALCAAIRKRTARRRRSSSVAPTRLPRA